MGWNKFQMQYIHFRYLSPTPVYKQQRLNLNILILCFLHLQLLLSSFFKLFLCLKTLLVLYLSVTTFKNVLSKVKLNFFFNWKVRYTERIWGSCEGAGSQSFGLSVAAFLGHKQGAGYWCGAWGLLAPIWYPNVKGKEFSHLTTVQGP